MYELGVARLWKVARLNLVARCGVSLPRNLIKLVCVCVCCYIHVVERSHPCRNCVVRMWEGARCDFILLCTLIKTRMCVCVCARSQEQEEGR